MTTTEATAPTANSFKYEPQLRSAITARIKHEVTGNGIMYRLIGFAALMVGEHGSRGKDRVANMLEATHDSEGLAASTKRTIVATVPTILKLIEGDHIPAFPASFKVEDVEAWVITARDFVGAKRANEIAGLVSITLRTLAAPSAGEPEPENVCQPVVIAPTAKTPAVPASNPSMVKSEPAGPDFTLIASNCLTAASSLPDSTRRELVTRLLGTFDANSLASIAREIVTLITPASGEQAAA